MARGFLAILALATLVCGLNSIGAVARPWSDGHLSSIVPGEHNLEFLKSMGKDDMKRLLVVRIAVTSKRDDQEDLGDGVLAMFYRKNRDWFVTVVHKTRAVLSSSGHDGMFRSEHRHSW